MDEPRIAGIDIDGVIADPSHRLHYLDRRPKDWSGFFAAAGADPLLAAGAVVADLAAAGHTIVYVSGRPEHLREVTRAWLATTNSPKGRCICGGARLPAGRPGETSALSTDLAGVPDRDHRGRRRRGRGGCARRVFRCAMRTGSGRRGRWEQRRRTGRT